MSATFILSINDEVRDSCSLPTEKAFALTGNNTGNLAFHHAMTLILGERQAALPWHTAPDRINEMGRVGVLPCANQLGPHVDFGGLAERFGSLSIPLVAIGLGAQAGSDYGDLPDVPEGTVRWVKEIAQRSPTGAPNIGVRGPFTLRVLEKYGLGENAMVTGCPSLFLSADPHIGKKIEERARKPFERVAVAAGHQGWKHLSKIEHSLVKIMEETWGEYIVQSPIEMINLARGEASLLSDEVISACRDYTKPNLSLSEFHAWSRRYFRVFFNVSGWMEFFRSFDFVVGTRIHGVMLALQSGVPGLCIAHDSRTREMCEVMQVPFIMAREVRNGFTLDELRELFSFDGASFDMNRKSLGKGLNAFLIANGVTRSRWLDNVTNG